MPVDLSKLNTPSLLELFDQSGDFTYVVLAIGQAPDDPPEWALTACAIFYEHQQIAVPPPKTGRKPKYSLEDGLLLDQVADLVVTKGLAVTKAVKQVTDEDTDGTNFGRLMRHWRQHSTASILQPKKGKTTRKTNQWLRRAYKRRQERFQEEIWAQARAEIAAGDLSTEEDPETEAAREARAVWLHFSKDLDAEQESQIKIAPLSRDLWVKQAKKWLLEHPEYLETPADEEE